MLLGLIHEQTGIVKKWELNLHCFATYLLKPLELRQNMLSLVLFIALSSSHAGVLDWVLNRKPNLVPETFCAQNLAPAQLVPVKEVLGKIKEWGLSSRIRNEDQLYLAAFEEGHQLNVILTRTYQMESDLEIRKDILQTQQFFKELSFSMGVHLPGPPTVMTFYVLIESRKQRDLFLKKLAQRKKISISSIKGSFQVWL